MNKSKSLPLLIVIDLFCGAGGWSTGIEKAEVKGLKIAKVIGCVNHDTNAIRSHEANHPEALHFIEDIRTLNLRPLVDRILMEKAKNPGAKVKLHASLECTNFSKAKGGLARDADSRTLAEHLMRYLDAAEEFGGFDLITIENVEEFMQWGPIQIKAKAYFDTHTELTLIKDKKTGQMKYGWVPIPQYKGIFFEQWKAEMCEYGYHYEDRILNSADFGAPTSRKRYFGIFAKHGLPIAWPKQTHNKKGDKGMRKWVAAREVLDLTLKGENILTRKKPYAEATLERIYNGLVKHKDEVHNGAFLDYYYGNGYSSTLDRPTGTVTTKDRINLVHFLLFPQWGAKCTSSINKPSPVLPARMDKMAPQLVAASKDVPSVRLEKGDSVWTRKIKEFMLENGIAEVCMRPLIIPELKKIMGFGESYVLKGTQEEQKKYIGNAVQVIMAKVMAEALGEALMLGQEELAAAA